MKQQIDIQTVLEPAKTVLILQADNPDADSLGSALALESILAEMGKQTLLYCAVDIPDYIKYLEGWSRVSKDFPNQFDASVIVDASTLSLFENLVKLGLKPQLATKPCIVLDHHNQTDNDIAFATVVLNDAKASSTCEVIYQLCKDLKWSVPTDALPYILTGILGDTQGLSNQLARAETYHIVGELVERGVNRPELEELRRAASKMPESIYKYKAELIKRTELLCDGRLALVDVTQEEITSFSPLYNPGPLIQPDMLQIEGVMVGIVCKVYSDGRVTGMIRCNPSAGIGADLAVSLGGGGHAFAAGFKLRDKSYQDVKKSIIEKTNELLDKINTKP